MMTGVLAWPRHLLTFEEWDALPEEELFRLELVEGVLVNSPPPTSFHQRAVTALTHELDVQLPEALIPLHRVAVVLEQDHPPTVRVPDVVVTSTEVYEYNPSHLMRSEVALAVEIPGDGTRRVDRVMKLSEYADAGIPQYWIVDRIDVDEPTVLIAYVLVGGEYELVAEATSSVDLEVAGNPVHLDLAALTRR